MTSGLASWSRKQKKAGRDHQDSTAQHGLLIYQAGVSSMVAELIDSDGGQGGKVLEKPTRPTS